MNPYSFSSLPVKKTKASLMGFCGPDDVQSPPATPPRLHFASASTEDSSWSSLMSSSLRPTKINTDASHHNPTHRLTDIFDGDQLEHINQLKSSFQRLTSQQKQVLLYEIVDSCDNTQLTYLLDIIAPRLKIDFLKELPIEISLHVLSFINDPKTLAQAACVSKFWNSLLRDETTWKSMCLRHQYLKRKPSIPRDDMLVPRSQRRNFSYRKHFKRKYGIATAWKNGGRVTVVDDLFGQVLVTSLQFDEDYIVVGCDNHAIEIFDARTAKRLQTLEGHEGGVWAFQFKGADKNDPDKVLVSGGCDRQVRVWNLETGELRHILRGHTSTVRCLKMMDKRIAVSGSRDFTLRVWDIQRGVPLHVLYGHQASVRCLDISGRIVASGSYDSTARLWDLKTGRCLHTLIGHYSQIYAIAFDGQKVVTGSLDSNIRVWSAETGQCLSTLMGHTSLVGQLQLRGNTLVSGGSDGCVRMWDLEHYECVHQISAHDNSVTCLQFDDRRMMSAGNDGKIKLWDIKQGTLIRTFTQPSKTVWKVQFSDTKAVVLMQRRLPDNPDGSKTVMEVHDFDLSDTNNTSDTADMDYDLDLFQPSSSSSSVAMMDVL